jgi:branched-subunit amino acid transport protein
MLKSYWAALALAAFLTFILRSFFLASKKPLRLPKSLMLAMDFVPVSVLAALVFQEFFFAGPLFPSLMSALAALALALFLGRDLLTIGGGLAAYWLLGLWGYAPF